MALDPAKRFPNAAVFDNALALPRRSRKFTPGQTHPGRLRCWAVTGSGSDIRVCKNHSSLYVCPSTSVRTNSATISRPWSAGELAFGVPFRQSTLVKPAAQTRSKQKASKSVGDNPSKLTAPIRSEGSGSGNCTGSADAASSLPAPNPRCPSALIFRHRSSTRSSRPMCPSRSAASGLNGSCLAARAPARRVAAVSAFNRATSRAAPAPSCYRGSYGPSNVGVRKVIDAG
jgi:hypothetical protein